MTLISTILRGKATIQPLFGSRKKENFNQVTFWFVSLKLRTVVKAKKIQAVDFNCKMFIVERTYSTAPDRGSDIWVLRERSV